MDLGINFIHFNEFLTTELASLKLKAF